MFSFDSPARFVAVDENARLTPDPALEAIAAAEAGTRRDAPVLPGGAAKGWLVLSAAEGEQNLLANWEPLFSFDGAQSGYLALQ